MPGTIVFKPLEANIVSKDKDLLGRMDPYLSFHLGGLKRVKGEVAKSGGQHPIWNDAITVEVTDQTSLTVDLKDKDMLIDDKIGSFEVDLRELASQGRVRKWYPIFRKNEPAGELLMEATFNGGNIGQYGMGQGQGQYGTSQGQYGTSQGQYGTSQGQYGTSQGQYGTSQGQYGVSQGQGQYGLSQGQQLGQGTSGFGGSYGQSGNVITTPGTVIGHTSTSYPVQSTTHSTSHHSTQYSASGLQQGQYGGLQQGQYGGLQQGQLGGLSSQHSGLQQGQLGGLSSQHGGLQQGQLGGLSSQYGGLQQGQLGGLSSQYGGLPQSQLGGFSSQQGGFPQTQSQGLSTEQYAKEAILRGSDPLNTQQNYYHNVGLGGAGGVGGHPQGQNLTQTPSFSGTDPLLYEGDKNRFSNPPQQMSYPGKTVESYGLGKHSQGSANPNVNPNANLNANPNANPNTRYY